MDQSPTTDYLTMVLSFPRFSPISVLSIFLLGLFRLVPIVVLAPFLGSRLPSGIKIGLSIILVVIFLPHLLVTTTEPITFDIHFIACALKEACLGLFIAFMISMPFYIAQSAGVLVDFLRGSSSLMVQDPSIQTQSSPIGLLYNYVLIVLFFQIGGFFYFFDGMLTSYSILPIDHFLPPAFFSIKLPFWQILTGFLNQFLSLSIQFAAPPIVSILMAEAFLGIANRLAPQVQIAFLGMSFKSLLGVALLWAGWFFILQQMGKETLKLLQQLLDMLHLMQ